MDVASAAASYWDAHVGSHLNNPRHWQGNVVTRQLDWLAVTGDRTLNPVDWFMQKFGPFHSMASICCGNGILEKHIAVNYLGGPGDAHIDGYDVSPVSVEIARESCKGLPGVRFHVCDVNVAVWADQYLDAVFANGALHHVTELDHCLEQLAKALKPTGYLYVNDYMGPRRFQFAATQLQFAREILAQLPDRFVLTRHIENCDPVALAHVDPSEAVCSDEIFAAIERHFTIELRRESGGTLLGPIFGGSCIDPSVFESSEGMAAIDGLCREERRLIDSGVIASDHLVVVARPRHG